MHTLTVTTPAGRTIELRHSFASQVAAYGIWRAATMLLFENGRVEASALDAGFLIKSHPLARATLHPDTLANVDAYLDRWGEQRWTGTEHEDMAVGPMPW